MRRLSFALAACTALALASPAAAKSSAPLRFSGIPDSDKEKLTKQYEAVTRYLSAALGRPVEYLYVPDYAASVTGLASNKLDFVWLGGVTAVQAEEKTSKQVTFVAARDADLAFKSYFIANRSLVDAGKFHEVGARDPQPLTALAALKPAFKDVSFTFGAKSSTSGHIMPRYFLELPEVGIDPETGFKAKPSYQLQGGHSSTLRVVADGSVDVGVLNYTNWESADAETKAKAPVIYVTPTYVDYCMVAHNRLGKDLIGKLRAALVKLDPAVTAEKAVLDAFSARHFVAVEPKQWDNLRTILKRAKEKGVLD